MATPTPTPTPTPEIQVEAGTPTPVASLPNSAADASQPGMPWAALAFVLILLASLTGLATVNARSQRDDR